MTALVLDAGGLIAVDRNDRTTMARLAAARRRGLGLRSNPMVLAQVWRRADGRQAVLARFMRSVDIAAIDAGVGRRCGELLAASNTSDAIDASIALLVRPGDIVLTSDPDDVRRLLSAAGVEANIVIVG
jgi:hypothetical protein